MRSSQVFLSYSSQDGAMAVAVSRHVRRLGFAIWRDVESLAPSTRATRGVLSALEHSDVMAVVWGAHAFRSRWVPSEVSTARRIGLGVIVVRHRSVLVPTPLALHHRIAWPPSDDGSARFGRLLQRCVVQTRARRARRGYSFSRS